VAKAGRVRTLSIGIKADISDFERKMKSVAYKMKKIGKDMQAAGKIMTAAFTLPAIAIGTAMTKAAMDLEATEAKYNTVFKGMTKQADEFIKEFQKLTPATTAAARSMASGIQDLLVPMGFARGAATKITGEFMHVAGALTNFNSATHSAEDVVSALQSAITGQYRSLKALGVQLDATTILEKAMAKGLIKSKDEMNNVIGTQVLLSEVYKQSGDALAAYNEESLDAKTRLGLLKAQAIDVAASFGTLLLPYINKLIEKTRSFVSWLDGLSEEKRKLYMRVGLLVAALGPLLIVLGKLLTLAPLVVKGFITMKAAVVALTAKVVALKTALAAVSMFTVYIGALGVLTAGLVTGALAARTFGETQAKARSQLIATTAKILEQGNALDELNRKLVLQGFQTAFSEGQIISKKITETKNNIERLTRMIEGEYAAGMAAGRTSASPTELALRQERNMLNNTLSELQKDYARIQKVQQEGFKALTGGADPYGFNTKATGTKSAFSDVFIDMAESAETATKSMDSLYSAVKSLVGEYANLVQKFASTWGLFDRVSATASVSGDRWISRLKGQLKGMAMYQQSMNVLQAKAGQGIISQDLLKELSNLGPEGARQLQNIARMSDAKLSEASGLYGQKMGYARGFAYDSYMSDRQSSRAAEQIIINITGNTIKTEDEEVEAMANKIVQRLKLAGVRP
jgi:hypothetical protein